MGLDVKVFRNEKGLKEIQLSETARGRGKERSNNVVVLDERWRESKRKLDEVNCLIRRYKDLVKTERLSESLGAREVGLKLKEIIGLQKCLKADERAAKKLLKEQLREIGNIIPPDETDKTSVYINYKPLGKLPVSKSAFIFGQALMEKQKLISFVLQHFTQHGFESSHSPSFLKSKLLLKLFHSKPFLELSTSIPISLITNPLQPLLLMHYKTKLDSKKFISYGVCFNNLSHQTEKISLVMFTEPKEEQDCFEYCVQICKELLTKLGIEIILEKKPARRLGLWYKAQYDFFCLKNCEFVKIASCANSGDYLSRSAKIKLIDNSIPSVISIKFQDLQTLLEIFPKDF